MAEGDELLTRLSANARAEGRDVLLEFELLELVPALGLSAPRHRFLPVDASDAAVARASEDLTTDRVVLKVQAPEVVHKSALGGVVFVERRAARLGSAIDEMRARFAKSGVLGFLVCDEVAHERGLGSELLMGMRHTRDFGPVVALGPGGVQAEELASVMLPEKAMRILSGATPMSGDTSLAHGRVSPQLLSTWLAAAERWCPEWLEELEVNPVVFGESGPIALDVWARLGEVVPTAAPRPLARMAHLLTPSSIAVVGVSEHGNPGRTIVQNLLADGFEISRIWVVKPGQEMVLGCQAVPDVTSLPAAVDLLVIAIAAEAVCTVVEEAITTQKARSMIVVPGGMGEHEAGRTIDARLREMLAAARRNDPQAGPIVNGGNCLGIRSRPGRYDTMFVPRHKMPELTRQAPLAIISQSGALLVSLMSELAPLSPRYAISVGNQVDLTLGDHLAYLAEDTDVEVFACYVEGFRPLDGRHWLKAARQIHTSSRLVLLYRAASTLAGRLASASHTAALAGDVLVTRQLAKRAGVLVADTLHDFRDLMRLGVALHGRSLGRRVGALSNAGFECVAFADRAGGLELVSFSPDTVRRLEAVLTKSRLANIVTVRNPLDVNPMLGDAGFGDAATAVLEDAAVDVAVIGCVPMTGALRTLPDERTEAGIVESLIALWRGTEKAWVVVVSAGAMYDPMAAALEDGGIPVFRSADRAMRLLSQYIAHRS